MAIPVGRGASQYAGAMGGQAETALGSENGLPDLPDGPRMGPWGEHLPILAGRA